MRKYIIIAIVVLIAIFMSITVSAEDIMEKRDSLNIASEEKNQLGLQNTNVQVVRKYVTGFCFIFPGANRVDELIQSEEILAEQFLIVENNQVVSYRVVHGNKVLEIDNVSDFERDKDLYFITKMNSVKNLLKVLSTDIEVYSCNYFADTTHLGSCVWLETDMGNFVYYRGMASADGKEYLFPAKDFVELITSVYIARSKNPDKDGGSPDINDYMDVSKYDINSLSLGVEANNNVVNKVNDGADATKRNTFFANRLIAWGLFSAIGIVLLPMIVLGTFKLFKYIRNAQGKKTNS